MANWKKWWITLTMLIQGLIGGLVILLWIFRHEPWTLELNHWLLTTPGQYTIIGLASYIILMAIIVIGSSIFRPTTSKQLIIARSGARHISVDRAAVEKSIRLSLSSFGLYNPTTKVKMLKNRQKADVTVTGMLSTQSNPELLKTSLTDTIENNLQTNFAIGLRKLRVRLEPYNHKKTVTVI
ncbi:alkaline shock response membrane anchor protein AmaP [Limosilactobacillus agrestimuris]|uniref:alkaline shock response membrane anchor protein AmaP n=1 Tax=Limosilactobacillus agrestimuris TaxID=2941331 RepID=UPI002041514D|nr:alkaline shock response membrane anchor protein AmaP [Limosilactobacillus agrestimuris]